MDRDKIMSWLEGLTLDRDKTMSWLEGLTQQDWRMFHSDSEVQVIANCALALLKAQPEIVLCKDCKYCVKEPNGELYCDILADGYEPLGSKKVNEDWFCADGERKEGR